MSELDRDAGVDYEALLNGSWDNIPEVKLLPDGTWRLRGRAASFKPAPEGEGKSPFFLFIYTVMEPNADVAEPDLQALGGDYDYSANRLFVRMYVEDAADWDNVRKHLAKHGIDTKGKGITESLKEFRKAQVLAYLSTRTYTSNGVERTENQAQQFAPVEA